MGEVASRACTFPVRVVVVDPEGRERVAGLKAGDEGPLRVGRAPENDLQVISPYISRRHAELWPHEHGILFEDLSSTSGSYVDGARIDKSLVRVGDTVRLGSPDGLRLTVHAIETETEIATQEKSRTEVLRVADLEESPYLSSTDRLLQSLPARRKSSERKSEERLIALISLVSDLLVVADADDMADKLLSRVMELLPVDRGMVLIDSKDGLEPRAWNVRGESEVLRTQIGPHTGEAELPGGALERPEVPFHPIRTVTDRVFSDGVGLLSLDAAADRRLEGSKSVLLQSVRAITAAPIMSSKKVYGVLYVDTHRTMRKDDEDTLDWLVAVAHQAGMVMDKLTLLEQQRRMLESMMKGLAASIDKRDGLTAGHSARVAHYSVGMARQMQLTTEDQYAIYYAALLHDYGKIGIDDAVLKKPARLTPDEYAHIQLHPQFTFDILSKIEFPPELGDLPMMAASHHEKWDGSGYPWGLQGEDIPLAGRIMAIADVYDSLTRKRHYREPMPMEEVLSYLEEGRGTHFDPGVLDAFFEYHAEHLASREARRSAKRQRAVLAPTKDALDETTHREPMSTEGPETEDMAAVGPTTREEEGTLRAE